MDVALEKAMIVERFNDINDESLIQAIKSLLDYGLGKQNLKERDPLLVASLKRGLQQSLNGQVRPHTEVWTEIRNKYKQ